MASTQKTETYWKEQGVDFSKYYQRTERFSLKRFVSRFLNGRTQMLMSLLDAHEDARVLDVGCGSGIHMKLLAPRVREIVGLDLSEQMLSSAQSELEKLDRRNWTLKLGDAQDLPFPDNSFDWIVSMGLFDYVPSAERVLNECARVLRNPGYMVFGIPKKPSLFFFLRTRIGFVIRKKLFGLPPIENIVTRAQLEDLLRAAGFRICSLGSLWTAMWMVKAVKTKDTSN